MQQGAVQRAAGGCEAVGRSCAAIPERRVGKETSKTRRVRPLQRLGRETRKGLRREAQVK